MQFPDNLVPTMDGNLSDWDVVPIDLYTIRNDRLYSPVADIHPVGRGEIKALLPSGSRAFVLGG